MNDFFAAAVIISIISYAIYKLFALFVRKKERLMLIEKISQFSQIDRNPVKIDFSFSEGKFIALRVALTLCGVGLGMLFAYLIAMGGLSGANEQLTDNGEYYRLRELINMLYAACGLFFGGLGTLAAFLIEHKMTRRDQKE